MQRIKYTFLTALLFLACFSSDSFAKSEAQPAAGDVLIVDIGRGTTRCGLHTQSEPIVFSSSIRWDHINFINDFRSLMNQVYSKLGISNKSAHPVLVIEPDEMNSWRRVAMSDVLMGENQVAWMYVMWKSMINAYGNDPGTGTVLSYHAEDNYSSIVAIVAGWPYSLGYGVEFDYHEPQLVRAADSVFWTTVRCPYADRGDLLNNIVLSGNHWKGVSQADIATFEERINIQRLLIAHDPRVVDIEPRDLVSWRASKKLVNDGLIIDWDLAFKQSHYTDKGSEYIRQWVF